jgi:signal transduction histidine kinase
LVATISIGLYVLRYQRRLFAGYLETEALATRRQSELQMTQAALLHSEKMKALGTFSAGIAHDFNNLLSVIRLSNELIEEEVRPQGVTKDNFEAIHQAIQRGRGIVNSMLGYARDDGQPRQFTAAELISEAVALLGKSFLGGLVLQVEVKPDTPPLFARKGRVEQMLFNLIVNATEAMRGQGTLTLRTGLVRVFTNCLLLPAPAPAFVEIMVQDSGPGIPPDVLPRIFDPFYTTKKVGSSRGTGLGLSMLYTMAREDGIGVAVETEPGKGTTFRLLLPLPAEPSLTPDRGTGHNSPVAPPA